MLVYPRFICELPKALLDGDGNAREDVNRFGEVVSGDECHDL